MKQRMVICLHCETKVIYHNWLHLVLFNPLYLLGRGIKCPHCGENVYTVVVKRY